MEEPNENCPVCYDKMNEVDVCTTICKHKFHTGCILRCNNVCPICRARLVGNPSTNVIPAGTYTIGQYLDQLDRLGISTESLSNELKQVVEQNEEMQNLAKAFKNQCGQREKTEKEYMKKVNPDKYKLFYGKK